MLIIKHKSLYMYFLVLAYKCMKEKCFSHSFLACCVKTNAYTYVCLPSHPVYIPVSSRDCRKFSEWNRSPFASRGKEKTSTRWFSPSAFAFLISSTKSSDTDGRSGLNASQIACGLKFSIILVTGYSWNRERIQPEFVQCFESSNCLSCRLSIVIK